MECILREWREADAKELVCIMNNKNIQDNLRDGIPYPYTQQDAAVFIERMMTRDKNKLFAFATEAEGRLVGSISVSRMGNVHLRTGEMGYYIGQNYWNKGYGSSAARQIVQYVFDNTDIVRIFAEPYAYNSASCRALEKAGFTFEGLLRKNAFKNGKLVDMKMYAVIKE